VTGPLHVAWSGAGEPVLLVHGSFFTARETFAAQAGLADEFRLGLVDRRGFGRSPDTPRVDFERDADDLVALLGEPMHVVGHSYGGVAALLAAARVPERVRSLTVIEPPAFALVPGNAAADELRARVGLAFACGEQPEVVYASFVEAWGFPRPSPERVARRDRRALASCAGERLPWEAEIPLAALARASLPVLVVSGGWELAPPEAQRLAGSAFAAVCDVLERSLGAERLVVPGATHAPQQAGPAFDDRLRDFLRRARTLKKGKKIRRAGCAFVHPSG
jgi:pimeloyl-ACP methyl ester carboxylesterase